MSYAHVGEARDKSTSLSVSYNDDETDNDDLVSIRSGLSRKSQLPTHLSEPLTSGDNHGTGQDDPYYVFRSDLYRKLESVDESLAEYLRVIHQTVRGSCRNREHDEVAYFLIFSPAPIIS
jgi:hypothetical protein